MDFQLINKIYLKLIQENCTGCQYNCASQLDHWCLNEEFSNYYYELAIEEWLKQCLIYEQK